MKDARWSFYIDRGGTFTDAIGLSPNGEVRVTKVLSSDAAPLIAIRRLLGLEAEAPIPASTLRMGTTVATNALLERRGTPTALVITRGFADALRIGTQARPHIFALEIEDPAPLASEVLEVDARVASRGESTAHLSEAFGHELRGLRDQGLESLAVVVLNAHLDGSSENEIAALARQAGFQHVSCSHDVAPEAGLVGRGDTTLVDAYLTPLLSDYVRGLRRELQGSDLLVMQSSGGLCAADAFRGRDAVLSGPAGGVVAALHVARTASGDRPQDTPQAAIAFDMGGTSTDVTRLEGTPERTYETEVAGVRLRAPMMAIHTVAAGGGSICRLDGGRLTVGPDSAGAVPGPLCYGDPEASDVALTDVNLTLGRLQESRFPFKLHRARAQTALQELAHEMGTNIPVEAVAEGFLEVAHEAMAQAIRQVTVARGHDVREHALVVFGGAGGQHAAALAQQLGIETILFPPFSGVLSAYGMALADVDHNGVRDAGGLDISQGLDILETLFQDLTDEGRLALENQGYGLELQSTRRRLDIRYRGTETPLTLPIEAGASETQIRERFEAEHHRSFGYLRVADHPVEVVSVRLETRAHVPAPELLEPAQGTLSKGFQTELYVDGKWREVPAVPRESIPLGQCISGPALILEATGTIVVEPDFMVEGGRILRMQPRKEAALSLRSGPRGKPRLKSHRSGPDPVRLEVYNHRFMALAERMGVVLKRTALSVNIRERLDFSCALFDQSGELIANAPHIPVHLGAMSESVRAVVTQHPRMAPGDVFVTNDPNAGGSHLPDITVVTPVHDPSSGHRLFFCASRGHHEDVGGTTPGSMPPFSRSLSEEGAVLRGLKVVSAGMLDARAVLEALTSGPYPARRPEDNLADLDAQVAANATGARLLLELVEREGLDEVQSYMAYVQDDAARRVEASLRALGEGVRSFEDALDDGTPIRVTLTLRGGQMSVDFSGTGPAVSGNLNAPRAVTVAATLYVLRALVGAPIPLNAGCLKPIKLKIPRGSVLDPPPGAAVAGGNVETSQRVVDVLLGALGRAAASQGTMNNLTLGNQHFGYYETIAGGVGATPFGPGRSGIHTHMTNTRITDPEVLEARFPVRVTQFSLRAGSGGRGRYRGGDGVIRELEALEALRVSILSERRSRSPFGLEGGAPGACGTNFVNGRNVGAKASVEVQPGQRVRIETPGGGGYGSPEPTPGRSTP